MTLDEILTAYEDGWRQAALEGRPQYFPSANRGGFCAMNIAGSDLLMAAAHTDVSWRCRDCGGRARLLTGVGIHLNDEHGWDWLRFATKFRNALAQGSR